jgi:hypothetical protein
MTVILEAIEYNSTRRVDDDALGQKEPAEAQLRLRDASAKIFPCNPHSRPSSALAALAVH